MAALSFPQKVLPLPFGNGLDDTASEFLTFVIDPELHPYEQL